MNASTWIALGAMLISVISPVLASLAANAKRDGKVDEVLRRLTVITEDHETRLRRGKL